MAGRKITDLPTTVTLDPSDLHYSHQAGTDKSVSLGQVNTFINDEIDNNTAAGVVADADNFLIRVGSASKKVLARIFKDYILGGVNRVVGNATGNIPLSDGNTNTNLRAAVAELADNASDSVLLDGKSAGNTSGDIPINNGAVNLNLNAEIFSGTKIKEIAVTWNMDTDGAKNVAHGLDWTKIKTVDCYFLNNAANIKIFRDHADGATGAQLLSLTVNATNIALTRLLGGLLDNANWNNATGKVFIYYEI